MLLDVKTLEPQVLRLDNAVRLNEQIGFFTQLKMRQPGAKSLGRAQ
jgi:hypothetical protein